jgi:Dullard-like phosphatase family protein
MSESVTKKHSYKKDQIRYFTNWASTKKSLNNIENKQKNLKKLKSNLKPKKSLNEQGLSTSFDKFSKTIEKKNYYTTAQKNNNLEHLSKRIKKNKLKIKNTLFSNISNMTLSFHNKNNERFNNSFLINKGDATNRNMYFNLIKKNENANDKDKDNYSYLTERQKLNNEIVYKKKILNSNNEKHNSFNKYSKKNNMYTQITDNGKRKEHFQSRNHRYISPNSNNNIYLTNISQNKSKKIFKENQLSEIKAYKTLNHSIVSEKKITPDIKRRRYNINNYYNNFSYIDDVNNNEISRNKSSRMKTLVLDLDETLIYTSFEPSINSDLCFEIDLNINEQPKYSKVNSLIKNKTILTKVYLSKRPHLEQFLSELNPFYEICIFSASSQKYASYIIDIIDKNRIISKKFFREDCIHLDNSETFSYIKDLEKINKNYNDIIIIDDNFSSFILQEENGIPIKPFRGDKNDIELLKLIPILKNLSGFYNVRTEIKKFVKNRTFIWFQGIKWLCNNCLSYSYIKEMIKIMTIDQIPLADKILYFFIEGENSNSNSNNNSSINNNNSCLESENDLNKLNENSISAQNNFGNYNIINQKIQKQIEKRKRGKYINFNNINDNKQTFNIINYSLINTKNRSKNKEVVNNSMYNKKKTTSKSILNKKDKENGKYYFTNKIKEKIKKKNFKMSNTNNFKTSNIGIYPFSNMKKKEKNSFYITNS